MVLAASGRSVPHLKYNCSVARPTDHFASFISSHFLWSQLHAIGHMITRGSKIKSFWPMAHHPTVMSQAIALLCQKPIIWYNTVVWKEEQSNAACADLLYGP